MLKIIIAVVMLSVSSLAYAGKWEYGEFQISTYPTANNGERGIFSFEDASRLILETDLLTDGSNDEMVKKFHNRMGWQYSGTLSIVRVLNKLGAEGWELTAHNVEMNYAERKTRYVWFFKRKID